MNADELRQVVCVVLAAGQGTRMRSHDTHKVCFEIAGEPAILRNLRAIESAGVTRFIVVVGAMATHVMTTVASRHPGAMFVYQAEPMGTGHAARLAANALERMGHRGPVFVTMGDKIIEPRVVSELLDTFANTQADLAFMTMAKAPGDTEGRIVQASDGAILGNVELSDIQRAQLMERLARAARGKRTVQTESLRQLASAAVSNPSKLKRLLGPVAALLDQEGPINAAALKQQIEAAGRTVTLAGRAFTAAQIEAASPTVNISLYVFRAQPMYETLAKLKSNNAQGEFYLTDAINDMATTRGSDSELLHRVRMMVLKDRDAVLSYNSPDELLQVESVLRRRLAAQAGKPLGKPSPISRKILKPVSTWITLFEKFPPKFRSHLATLYGDDGASLDERRAAILATLKLFAARYGKDREVVISRAPGRVNLMGRHVDHRGGYVNVMAINREVVIVASVRQDDTVRLVNADSQQHPDKEFRIAELLGGLTWENWLHYVNSQRVQQIVLSSQGDWSNYVKAAVLRLQESNRHVQVLGMDCAVSGNVPMAAGLSSSSAVVVATAAAAVTLNQFDLTAQQFVDLCGEGEWFVGSRGGSSDHAAIRFSQRGKVAHVGFFPFRIEGNSQFPPDLALLIANSHIRAAKSAGARSRFNEKVATYEIGFLLLKDRFPQYAHLLEHLRDLNPARLGVKVGEIYSMLRTLPEPVTRQQLLKTLAPQHRPRLEQIFASHQEPDGYWLRSVVMFGIAECERSRLFASLLRNRDLAKIGQFMRISHNGDRVSGLGTHGRMQPEDWRVSDARLDSLIEDLRSEEPSRVSRAQLWLQPGGYACSTPELDRMVDLVNQVEGVVGAQLAGAGLGGCIMVLVKKEVAVDVEHQLARHYYEPAGLEPAVTICVPVEGAGLLTA
ncbi:MAG: NTP transferase domain-containing protein [Verrucomicrobia bacterium]|nr:NTP transferase domain-containing protein [Verrucomicrobiota bacterium]